MTRAVVFAYHNVGVRCLSVLLRQGVGVEVALVVTHRDSAGENIWFDSVAALAGANNIAVVTPQDPNEPAFIAQIAALKVDFLFSFYYRMMLSPALLTTASRGAFNMHGSLLPKYRGRVPINWAIIKGETETGATLHEMVAKPDAGRIVDQEAVAILADDHAIDVFNRVVVAAEVVLTRSIPKLIDGSAVLRPQNLSEGGYFGGRKPADGVIDWADSAENIHNLVRAVSPPYPGATTTVNGMPLTITRSQRAPAEFTHNHAGMLNVSAERVIALCGDGRMLRVIDCEFEGRGHNEVMLAARLGVGVYALGK